LHGKVENYFKMSFLALFLLLVSIFILNEVRSEKKFSMAALLKKVQQRELLAGSSSAQ